MMNNNGHQPAFVGSFELCQPLGEGGMGEVHLARSAGSRLVALKIIRAEYADDYEFRERFRREVDAARRVSGFFTPPVLDADTTGPCPWLATAYVPAPSLREVVLRFGVLTEPGLRALGAGLAEALVAIHAAGLVHRDLKPGNVLITGDGPRVIDFGISRALDATRLTSTGGTLGTPGYLAPEQIASGRETGPSADVFAFGCVLTFAATGNHPFGTGGPADLYYRIVYDQPYLDGLSDGLRPLVAACLDKDPARRPPVAQLVDALTPAEPADLLTAGLRHDLALRDQAAAAILARPPAAPPHPAAPPSTAPQPTAPTRPSRRRFLSIAAAVGASAVAGAAVLLAESNRVTTGTTQAAGQQDGTTVPAAPAPSWSQTASTALTNGKLALLGNTVVWFDGTTALGFDASTGNPLWTRHPALASSQAGWLDVSGAVLYGSAINVQGDKSLLYGLDDKGNQVVDVVLGVAVQNTRGYAHSSNFATLFGATGSIVVLGVEGGISGYSLTALDTATKKVLWSHNVTNSAFTAVPDATRCYIQDDTSTLAVDLATGATLWSVPNTAQSGTYPVLAVSGDTVILTGVKVLALDPATGKQRWTAVNESTGLVGPVVTDTRVFVSDGQNILYSIDSATGNEVWHLSSPLELGTAGPDSTEPGPSGSATVLAFPLLGPNSGVLAVRASNGQPLWARQGTAAASGQQVQWAPLVGPSAVYAASATTLYAFPSESL